MTVSLQILGIMPSEAKGHLPQLTAKLDDLLGIGADPDRDSVGESDELPEDLVADAAIEPGDVDDPEAEEELTAESPESGDATPDTLDADNSGAQSEKNPVADSEVDPGPTLEAETPEEELVSDEETPASNVVPMPFPADASEQMQSGEQADPLSDSQSAEQTENEAPEDPAAARVIELPQTESWMPSIDESGVAAQAADDATPGSMLRIGNSRLAELINASGELSLVRTQLQDTLDATRMDLDLLRTSMSSMRAGLRDLELEADAQIRARPEQQSMSLDDDFDPLQLDRYSRLQAKSREVTELLDQLAKVERDLDGRASNLDGALRQQLHLGDQLQSGLMSARMVNMTDYLPRLRYLVRETSRQADKPVELRFEGGDIQVDRQVIETMMAPLEHMIRNSVAHGIESRNVRKQSGKPEAGSIALALVQQGSELVVTFGDDGSGLNLDKLHQRAIELGLAESAEAVTDVHLLQVITQPGYSTADTVTMEAGRGVGMDVVYQAVRDLGGSMTLLNNPGMGTTFQFRLPVTLALTQALLVRAVRLAFRGSFANHRTSDASRRR